MWRVRCGAAAAFVAAALATIGCEGEGAYGEVSGTITYEGRPVEGGQIKFVPAAGPTAGAVVQGGKYSAKVPVGPVKVTISGLKAAGKKKLYATPDSPERDLYQELLPAKYNEKSELTFEVAPGANEKNWELTK
jgi:hypothetical protein